jgi:hypothetical protein
MRTRDCGFPRSYYRGRHPEVPHRGPHTPARRLEASAMPLAERQQVLTHAECSRDTELNELGESPAAADSFGLLESLSTVAC